MLHALAAQPAGLLPRSVFQGSLRGQGHVQLRLEASFPRLCALVEKWNEAIKTAAVASAVRQAIGANVLPAADLSHGSYH